MNFNGKGHIIANLIDKNGNDPVPLFVSADRPNDSTPDYIVNVPGKMLSVCPEKDGERSIRYVTGASGSGKSFWTARYIREYNNLYAFPKKRKKDKEPIPDGDPNSRYVYIISSIDEDSCFDSIGPFVRRLKIRTDDFLEDRELTAEAFRNSLVIFDDTDCIIDKFLKQKITGLLNSILETGRHFNVDVVYTSHLACAGHETKRILNEAKSVTIFPSGLGSRTLKYLLSDYMGLSKTQIREVKASDSRAVTIVKGYPMCVITDRRAYIVPIDDS